MLLFIIIFLSIYLGANGLLFRALLSGISQFPLWAKISVSALYWLLALSFIFIESFHRKLPMQAAHVLYWIGTGWLAFFVYMLLLFGVVAIARWLGQPTVYFWAGGISLIAVALIAGFVHFNHPVVRHQSISIENPNDSIKSLRVVAVSDVHLGYGIRRGRAERYVRLINEQKPDLILISGDLIDVSVRPLWEDNMQETLRQLRAPMGVYMVPGNHEYISGINESIRFIQTTGIKLLRDSIVTLPCGIQIIGRDDKTNARRKPVSELLAQTNANAPVFLLDHQPDNDQISQIVNSRRVDFALFGHTHHGQIWPMTWITDLRYRQSHGYARQGRTHVYVSSGLGLWGPPFRIGTDSELLVVDFRF